jgi:hypothetical protein
MSFYVLAGTSSVNENLWGSLYLQAFFGYGDVDCKSRNQVSHIIQDPNLDSLTTSHLKLYNSNSGIKSMWKEMHV